MLLSARGRLTRSARLVLLIGLTGAPGCSRLGLTSPVGGNDLPLVAAQYRLVLIGSAISPGPGLAPCTPFAVPPEGTSVTTVVALAREGNSWVARSVTPDAGDLVFHFEPDPNSPLPGVAGLKGSARGSARDGSAPPKTVRATILGEGGSGSARLDGAIAFANSAYIEGTMYGAITFVDSFGRTGSCPSVLWVMNRPVPAGG